MKELTITFSHMSRRVLMDDGDKAIAAYESLKTAMAEHRQYSNDTEKTVELDYGHSTETIMVGAVAATSIQDLDAGEESILKAAVWQERMKAKIANALQPAAE